MATCADPVNTCCEELQACVDKLEQNIDELFERTDQIKAILEGGSPVDIAIWSDAGYNNANQLAAATIILDWDIAAMFTVGDNVYPDGEAADVADRFTNIQTLIDEEKVFPTLGNHDMDNTGTIGQPVINHFPYLPKNDANHSRYYSKFIEEANAEFFILNSGYDSADVLVVDNEELTSDQYSWFVNALAASSARWKIVLFHHPYVTSINAGSAKIAMDWNFETHGIDLVINGHSHLPEHWQHDDLDVINAGSAQDGRVVTAIRYGKVANRLWAAAANGVDSPEVVMKLSIHPAWIIVTYYRVSDGQAIYAFQIN